MHGATMIKIKYVFRTLICILVASGLKSIVLSCENRIKIAGFKDKIFAIDY